MGFREKVESNIPKVDLQSYTTMIAGDYKSGKTRFWKEIIEFLYPNDPDAGLLLAFEPGYTSWKIDSHIPMHKYDWEFFRKEVVPGLVQEARTGRKSKVLGVDTADRCIDMATDWILNQQNKKYAAKYKTLQDVSDSTSDNGYILLKDELRKQFDALKNAGYGLLFLAWTKDKQVETRKGVKYNALELNMSKTGKDIFLSQSDIVCVLYNDIKVLDVNGEEVEENKTTKKGKAIASNFHSTETSMYFRPTDYIDISGGRFIDLPEKVPYGVENFFDVFEKAVQGNLKGNNKTIKELRESEIKEREEDAKEFAEEQHLVDSLIEQIDEKIQELRKQKKANQAGEKFKSLFGTPTGYKKHDNVEDLQVGLDFLNTIE